MNSIYIIVAVVVVVLLVIILVSISSMKKRNRLASLDELDNRNSTLKALPVQYLLNKVSLMPKSEDVEISYLEWEKKYNYLVKEEGLKIKELISEIETLIYSRKYKKAKELLNDLQSMVGTQEKAFEVLLNDLSVATQVDVKNREEITNQKELFRNYRKMYQSNFDNYKPYNLAIERYFVNIEDSFTNIDILLNQSQVDKARNKAGSLEAELLKMKDILNNLPAVLAELTRDLPIKYKEVEQRYNEIVDKKYNLEKLRVPKRLKKVNAQILRVLSQNNDVLLKELQETSHEMFSELNKLMSELDDEVRANEELDKIIQSIIESSVLADKKCKIANLEFEKIEQSYILFKNEKLNLMMQTSVLNELLTIKNEIVADKMSSSYIASDLEKKARELLPKLQAMIVALSAYIKRINDLRLDEKRLFDEYNNMLYLIKDCEARLHWVNLPTLSKSYYETISDCKTGLIEVNTLLNGKPLNIDLANARVASVCEVVYKLYDNSRNLLKTAQMAENTIVFGNRYRSTRPEVDSMLSRAQIFFDNGEYTKALSIAIESIETIFPSIRKELLQYKSAQLKNNSYV